MNTYKNLFDAYEWAAHEFFKNLDETYQAIEKRQKENLKNVQKALKTGVRDPKILRKDFNLKENDTVDLSKGKENIPQIQIKQEKTSDTYDKDSSTWCSSDTNENVPIKTEKEEMPAPAWIPPKKKGKDIKVEPSSRTTRSKQRTKTHKARDSDVVRLSPDLPCVLVSDTESSDPESDSRSKTKKAQKEQLPQVPACTRAARSIARKNQDQSEEECSRLTRTKSSRKGEKIKEEDDSDSTKFVRTTRTKTRKQKDKDGKENEENSKESPKRTTKLSEKVLAQHDENTKNKEANTEIDKEEKSAVKDKKKKSKSNSPLGTPELNAPDSDSIRTEYEDAQSEVDQPVSTSNATFVLSKEQAKCDQPLTSKNPVNRNVSPEVPSTNKPPVVSDNANANGTFVLSKEKRKYDDIFNSETSEVLFTDDDSTEKLSPPRKMGKSKIAKEVFSPYAKTTTKKKVEAFEKLQSASSSTRSISVMKSAKLTPNAVNEKVKYFTPSAKQFQPSSSSTSKISRLVSLQSSASSNESLLALKKVQKEARDKQKKQQERELAQKKKEAMLQAASEAKKKLNEEKQLKAQQQRKAKEAEKQKLIEAQKQKEERQKQKEAEKEEYLRQQKLENEKKRLAQQKKLEEIQKLKQQQLQNHAKNPPAYMTSKAPKLPTNDCYDSDDPDYKTVPAPSWCSGEASRMAQLAMLTAGETIKNTLFSVHAQTPDLKEIFEDIDPKKLKRASSVLWRKPPRYTMMPDLENTKFSDDEYLED